MLKIVSIGGRRFIRQHPRLGYLGGEQRVGAAVLLLNYPGGNERIRILREIHQSVFAACLRHVGGEFFGIPPALEPEMTEHLKRYRSGQH